MKIDLSIAFEASIEVYIKFLNETIKNDYNFTVAQPQAAFYMKENHNKLFGETASSL